MRPGSPSHPLHLTEIAGLERLRLPGRRGRWNAMRPSARYATAPRPVPLVRARRPGAAARAALERRRRRSAPRPAAPADWAGAVPRPNGHDAETAALLALVRGRRPGRSRDGSGCRVGAARTPGRDAVLGTMSNCNAALAAHP